MKAQTREEPRILAAAERQMQAWARIQEISKQLSAEGARTALGPYICLSRECGAGGSLIAERLGELLGWEVLDKNVLDEVALRYRVSRLKLDLVDETAFNWAYDIIGPWLDREIVSHEKYFAQLCRVVLAKARRGHVVLVGRGAQFMLPREFGLAVRIIAPKKFRIAQIMERLGLTTREAERLIDETDRGRRQFAYRYFHRDIDDPHLYDIVLNVEHVGIGQAAEKIAEAMLPKKPR